MAATTRTAPAAGTIDLEYDGKSLSLPLIKGSEGEVGIDVAQRRATTGLLTFDPGLGNEIAMKLEEIALSDDSSSATSCIPTSISTRASSTRRSASR